MMTKLSVVIPTFNEEKEILLCLQSLEKQTWKNYEVIVVDDGSIDQTIHILEDYKPQNFSLHIFKQKHQGPALARNLGATKATGEILVFVDSDMTFDEKFLEKLTLPIRNKTSRGTFSKDEYVSNWENVWARCWNINFNLPIKRRLPKNYPDTQTVFRAILKKEFDKVGGFDKGGYTDDSTLSKKLGFEADNAKHAFFYHHNPSNLVEIYFQAKWVAKRNYKFGVIGIICRLLLTLLPISLVVGIVKAIYRKEPMFVIFKIVYSTAIMIGLFEMVFYKKLQK